MSIYGIVHWEASDIRLGFLSWSLNLRHPRRLSNQAKLPSNRTKQPNNPNKRSNPTQTPSSLNRLSNQTKVPSNPINRSHYPIYPSIGLERRAHLTLLLPRCSSYVCFFHVMCGKEHEGRLSLIRAANQQGEQYSGRDKLV